MPTVFAYKFIQMSAICLLLIEGMLCMCAPLKTHAKFAHLRAYTCSMFIIIQIEFVLNYCLSKYVIVLFSK